MGRINGIAKKLGIGVSEVTLDQYRENWIDTSLCRGWGEDPCPFNEDDIVWLQQNDPNREADFFLNQKTSLGIGI